MELAGLGQAVMYIFSQITIQSTLHIRHVDPRQSVSNYQKLDSAKEGGFVREECGGGVCFDRFDGELCVLETTSSLSEH